MHEAFSSLPSYPSCYWLEVKAVLSADFSTSWIFWSVIQPSKVLICAGEGNIAKISIGIYVSAAQHMTGFLMPAT